MNVSPSDQRLVRDVAAHLAQPKTEPADSFVLHAPLELLARVALLPYVHASARDAVHERLRWLASTYDDAGDPVDEPAPVAPDPSRLVAALGAGDLHEVDRQAVALAAVATGAELRRLLAPPILASLGAAAHGGILLHLLVRAAPPSDLPLGIARQALREVARHPTWYLHWFEDPDEPAVSRALADALLDVPRLGLPGSDFIHPIMSQAEDSGIARRLLSGVVDDPGAAERDLARVAAWSMLQEPPEHAPYGWSHCLTMPQATVRLADVTDDAVLVAATYVVGFRAAEGVVELDPAWVPDPGTAAGRAWHDPSPGLVADLASYAAAHEDAHLAKYTLACIDAAGRDPRMRHLHLAAAARLGSWWAAREHEPARPVSSSR